MQHWARVKRARICGGCGRTLAIGDPVLVITLARQVDKIRCATCNGPAPPDLPDYRPGADPLQLPALLQPMKRLPFDREPGEEG